MGAMDTRHACLRWGTAGRSAGGCGGRPCRRSWLEVVATSTGMCCDATQVAPPRFPGAMAAWSVVGRLWRSPGKVRPGGDDGLAPDRTWFGFFFFLSLASLRVVLTLFFGWAGRGCGTTSRRPAQGSRDQRDARGGTLFAAGRPLPCLPALASHMAVVKGK